MPPRTVRIAARAEHDITDAAAWYEEQRVGLSIEFLHSLDQAFADISERPQAFRVIRQSIRRILLRRFPYGVFFMEDGSDVTVLAVVHTRWHPRFWPSRPTR